MQVDLIDLKARYKDENKELLRAISKTLKKGNLILTEELSHFEKEVSSFIGTKYCVGLNSGTDALMMALMASGIKRGDEVITSSKSFIASVGAIHHIGAKPILVDIDDDLNMDTNLIESKITNKTKAIMPVHWTGRICNMKNISRISKKYNLKIIEDAAQGIGSYYHGKHAGTFGECSAFSCHPLKNLNAIGDAGFMITNNKKIYEKVMLYRNHGLFKRDDVRIFGINSRLDVINAVVLSLRLKKLNNIIKKRKYNVKLYRKYLSDVPEIKIPTDKEYESNPYVMFITQAEKRNELQKFLASKKVQSMIYYGTPLHKHIAFKKFINKSIKLPNVEKICKKVLALPHHQYLSEDQVSYVCNLIRKFYK